MIAATTRMLDEAAQTPGLIAAQRSANAAAIKQLARLIADRRCRSVLTIARGSSDNAATFARYLIEQRTGLPTASFAPSVSSVYRAQRDFSGDLVLAISQSGMSPDILAAARAAKEGGATLVALVNDTTSPLAAAADVVLAIGAGAELSVAATKSFALSLVAILDLLACVTGDAGLNASLAQLNVLLGRAWQADWSPALDCLTPARNLFVIARGHAFGVAQELALKLKETSAIHAEAISAAEVRHGPMTLVGPGFPVIILGQDDAARDGVRELASEFAKRGAVVLHSGLDLDLGVALPVEPADPAITPLLQLHSFYRLCEGLARLRGFDPDSPAHLNKVTRTL